VLPGKLRHRRQGGDGHGVEAIAMKSSSSMSESSTRCVIGGNMEGVTGEVRHRRRTCGIECVMAARSR
jgi:hypothetical protein